VKKFYFLIVVLFTSVSSLLAQFKIDYDPQKQPTGNIQYFRPTEADLNCGDPIPFFHNGKLQVFWLLDKGNHQLSMGYHQWAHMSTENLKTFTHHSLALAIEEDWEKSIGTGSVIFERDTFFIFYTTRTDLDNDGKPEEQINMAYSLNGIDFTKKGKEKIIALPEIYDKVSCRDPHVYRDPLTGIYYMIITTALNQFEYKEQQGVLVYFTSKDMYQWEYKGIFYAPGSAQGFTIPECATLFDWNGWYYLTYKVDGGTFYRMSKSVTGPWITPKEDNFGNDYSLVYKIAAFTNNCKIAVGFVPMRKDKKDNGSWLWGGNLIFRELVQGEDGRLGTKFPEEMTPKVKSALNIEKTSYSIQSKEGFKPIKLNNIPVNCRIRCKIKPMSYYSSFGFYLRSSKTGAYKLDFLPKGNSIRLGNTSKMDIIGLDKEFTVDIVMHNDIIDVCINNWNCITNRCPEQIGTELVFYGQNGDFSITEMKVDEL
jgi:hypothetical protein